eukprot:m.485368 g.485368  ORF g.485368 m.485368 type:complete len:198 (-) comp23791_c0_seq1:165-758(-)
MFSTACRALARRAAVQPIRAATMPVGRPLAASGPAATKPLPVRWLQSSAVCRAPDLPVDVGHSLEEERTFSPEDVAAFAKLSGDTNPIHLDAEYAATTQFGKPIVHGVLMNGVISGLLGAKMPGPGSIYVSQTIEFKAPLYVGETMVARAEVLSLERHSSAKGERVFLTVQTQCLDKESRKVLMDGKAVVLVPVPSQ